MIWLPRTVLSELKFLLIFHSASAFLNILKGHVVPSCSSWPHCKCLKVQWCTQSYRGKRDGVWHEIWADNGTAVQSKMFRMQRAWCKDLTSGFDWRMRKQELCFSSRTSHVGSVHFLSVHCNTQRLIRDLPFKCWVVSCWFSLLLGKSVKQPPRCKQKLRVI